jgi:hypothetical protein
MLFKNIIAVYCEKLINALCEQKAGLSLQVHTELQPRRPTSISSLPWEPQISHASSRLTRIDNGVNKEVSRV